MLRAMTRPRTPSRLLLLLLLPGCAATGAPTDVRPAADLGPDGPADTTISGLFDGASRALDGTIVPNDGEVPGDALPVDVALLLDSAAAGDDAGRVAGDDAGRPASCEPRVADPGVGPAGYRLDGWRWTRHGVLFEDPGAGPLDGLLSPAVALVEGRRHLWAARKRGTVHVLLHAVAADGVTFSPLEPVRGLEESEVVAYPAVLHEGGRFRMWIGSGALDLYEGDDGVAWRLVARGVLRPGAAGEFDALTVLYPSVVRTAQGLVLFYTGFDGQRFAIGRARSDDGVTWQREPDPGPILAARRGDFDNQAVAQPGAVAVAGGTLLWYGGYDTSRSNPGPYRIGLASSVDGRRWTREGLTLDLLPAGLEAYGTRDPAVVRTDDGWWMVYVGMGDDRRYRLFSASSRTCPPTWTGG